MATPSDNVFAPPRSTVADVVPAGELEKASRGMRLLAKILDGTIGTIGFWPAYLVVFPQMMRAGGARSGAAASTHLWTLMARTGGLFYIGVAVGLVVLVLNIVWLAQNGQTVGKKICRVRIVRTDGSKATFWRIFLLRYLISGLVIPLVRFFGFIYVLVDICFIFGSARRCVHDYIADTIVVRA